ncbi:DUF6301 family protein [Nocardia gamkensis]|uniref:Uncharacterized protein n=1 Tax=Nocardia gamkensis TaxID=352869 RepID=A0A7X6R3S3_9NOCA|nr:DUF6301 family protein [Nocardia gamkensis]NKY27760.1 hypothetical protein [Nocardia gamkensis]
MTEWRALDDAQIVELATRLLSLDWSWRMADTPQLAAEFGWEVQSLGAKSAILDTGFGMASGGVQGRDEHAEVIEVAVTSRATRDTAGRASLRDAFARMASVLTDGLGAPSSQHPGEDPEIRWAGEKTTLQLVCLRTTVRLYLVTNSWLAMHDKTVELQEQGLI